MVPCDEMGQGDLVVVEAEPSGSVVDLVVAGGLASRDRGCKRHFNKLSIGVVSQSSVQIVPHCRISIGCIAGDLATFDVDCEGSVKLRVWIIVQNDADVVGHISIGHEIRV